MNALNLRRYGRKGLPTVPYKLTLQDGIDLNLLADITEGKSGADIKEICNQAGLNAFRRESHTKRRVYTVNQYDLEMALNEFVHSKVG